jgi:hypothetical protein
MELVFWKERIKVLIRGFLSLNFSHTYRAFNQKADELSKQALDQPKGIITYFQMGDGLVGSILFLKCF